ncbi:SDR family NAD(P)-dependent oxidoreductase [Sphingomonas sp. C3-2]|uniref:SDR family NAD(P)-dependent oxidoreductase n=1 Tax=Sphingomonas sp. C3-2 TaxID=3062169 RepID=UPI00294A9B5A|nr:SDR family NAD(P)-dependent oxidoreductase [Sphingomonas sp. C3-2]WOK37089.1 SDR family NAD(P)-dependent oxidoreductase [Sphingomonas sp. C3-2]
MSTPMDLSGKVALVTGASSGIGQATAEYLAERGARVAVVARTAERGRETVERILAAGGTAIFIQADVEEPEAIAAMVEQTVDHFGRLDIAFNNAGMTGAVAPFHEQSLSDWDQVIRTNLSSIFLSMKHEIIAMLKCGGGSIVNNCSGAGVMAAPGLPHYTAAKHGVLGLTKSAAKEYAPHGIRVNAICPGFIETPQLGRYIDGPEARAAVEAGIPIGHMGQPIEIARAVAFLSSAEGAYISGDTMFVDGGVMCR